MRVYIKGMEMPKCCDDCWALDDYGDYPRCRITDEQRGYNFQIREKRMDKCPLVPAADVRPMVTCSDCKWWTKQEASLQGRCELLRMYPTGAWFCANGKREES